jgi:ATP-dependent protease ClpP protease subunit
MKQDKRADFLKMFQQEPDEFLPVSTPIAYSHMFRLNRVFEDISQFSALIDTLEQAGEGDIIQIRLASPGGSLDAIIPVLAAMEGTDAFVHCHVDTSIASAATFIMLQGDMITFNPLADVMLHNISFGAGGSGGNVEARVNHIIKTSNKLIKETYKDFVSDAEMERLLNGLELYFTAEECTERLKARDALRKKEDESIEDDPKIVGEDMVKFIEDNPELFKEPVKTARKPKAPK